MTVLVRDALLPFHAVATFTVFACVFYRIRKLEGKLQENLESRPKCSKKSEPLPLPGPPGIPFFGNLLQLDGQPNITFTKWSKIYGPIFRVQMGSKLWVVVNDASIVKELFSDRGAIYSSRDLGNPVINILTDHGNRMVLPLLGSGERQRKARRLTHTFLAKHKNNIHDTYIDIYSRKLVISLLNASKSQTESGINISSYTAHYPVAVVCGLTYGWKNVEENDNLVNRILYWTRRSALLVGPEQMKRVFLPIFDIFPNPALAGAHEVLDGYYSAWLEIKKDMLERMKQEGEKNEDDEDNFSSYLWRVREKEELSDYDIAFLSIIFITAGAETPGVVLLWAIALLANYPQYQEEVFKELMSVVGCDRLPACSDIPDLPYLSCFLYEVMRYGNMASVIPHASTQDDVFMGYHIPAGTTIYVNTDAINFNTEYFSNPHKFDPSRHMNLVQNQQNFKSSPKVVASHINFGAGRRICAGLQFARRELLVALARVLWTFRIDLIKDKYGNDIPIDLENPKDPASPVLSLREFNVRLVKRAENVVDVLGKAA